LEAEPGFQPWSLRGIVLREERVLVGDIGCHTMPGPAYLAELAPGGVEMGYGLLEPWRRRGIATEAIGALMHWAGREHGVRRFVVSISPANAVAGAGGEAGVPENWLAY
jgi:ribosomal-protein-alanine N-acetyltransferase